MKQYLALLILVVVAAFSAYVLIIEPIKHSIEQRVMTIDKILQESK